MSSPERDSRLPKVLSSRVTIEVLYFAGCPNLEPTLTLARNVAYDLGIEPEIRQIAVDTPRDAEALAFLGSPSVRVNGRDIEPAANERTDFALGCRIYGAGGVPPRELVVTALKEA